MFPNVTKSPGKKEDNNCSLREEHFKNFVYNKYHHLFDHKQVIKYTIWFNRLSKNNKNTVVLDNLAQVFVDHKLIRSKVELVNAFSTFLKAKIKHNDITYTVNIDEFLDVLAKSSRIIDMDKFNQIVDMENKFSEKTLFITERRKLLFEYVVKDRLNRAADMENICERALSRQKTFLRSDSTLSNSGDFNRAIEEKQREKAVLEEHRKQVEDANRFVGKVEFDMYCHKYSTNKIKSKTSKSIKDLKIETAQDDIAEAEDVMQPLEFIFDQKLLAMAQDTRKILYEDTVHDEEFNNMLSPTKAQPVTRRRTVAAKDESCLDFDVEVNPRPSTSPLPAAVSSPLSSPHSWSSSLFSRSPSMGSKNPRPLSRQSTNSLTRCSPSSLSRSLSQRASATKSTSPRSLTTSLSMPPQSSGRPATAGGDVSVGSWSSGLGDTDPARPQTACLTDYSYGDTGGQSPSSPSVTLRKNSPATMIRSSPINKLKINFDFHN